MSSPPAVATDRFDAVPATRAQTAKIQAFNEANPDYWLLAHGHPPRPAMRSAPSMCTRRRT